MNRVWLKWLGGLFAVALVAMAGVYVYDLGVARGLAEGAAATGVGVQRGPFSGWWRPWGFFPFFPFLFIALWFLVLRGLFWRGPRYGRWWYGRWDDWRDGVPPIFEEWHRRAHDRQDGPAATKV
jgi:hypothetical protein